MTDADLAELRELCCCADDHDISEWDTADVYRDLRLFQKLVPDLIAERDALKTGIRLLSARLDDLARRLSANADSAHEPT